MEIQILFADDALMVINKPAGLVVNRADTVQAPTLQDWIADRFDYPLARDSALRNGIVHRLDKDTSGVMVVAKTTQALSELQRQFHDRETSKKYLALVHGYLLAREGTIKVPMERSAYNRHKFVVSSEGRMTETAYKVLALYSHLKEKSLNVSGYQGFSLLELWPKTGRTHQIRVIMTHLKHPLVGDSHYVGRKRARADALWCRRQFLHADSLTFFHPVTKEKMMFSAPLAADLNYSLSLLEEKHVD